MTISATTRRRKQSAALPVPADLPVADEGPARMAALLVWYDSHRRALPWRARADERPEPYRVWLSEIMLQQTTVKAVGPYFEKFVARWPSVDALAAAPRDDVLRMWAGLGYYSRARNLHACAVTIMQSHDGRFPDDPHALLQLPGIGAYTAAAIAAIAFDRPVMPVDGNIERVVARLFAVEEPLPKAKAAIKTLAASLALPVRAGDAAQAMMDLGATVCTPKKPACALCPLTDGCVARIRGDMETFPRKGPKANGTLRRGAAFVIARGNKVLLGTRPEKGLLGGMTQVPGTDWSADFDEAKTKNHAPAFPGVRLRWRRIHGTVRHVFTHFPLELIVHAAEVPKGARAPRGLRWVAVKDLADEALPNVMRKVLAHAGVVAKSEA